MITFGEFLNMLIVSTIGQSRFQLHIDVFTIKSDVNNINNQLIEHKKEHNI